MFQTYPHIFWGRVSVLGKLILSLNPLKVSALSWTVMGSDCAFHFILKPFAGWVNFLPPIPLLYQGNYTLWLQVKRKAIFPKIMWSNFLMSCFVKSEFGNLDCIFLRCQQMNLFWLSSLDGIVEMLFKHQIPEIKWWCFW